MLGYSRRPMACVPLLLLLAAATLLGTTQAFFHPPPPPVGSKLTTPIVPAVTGKLQPPKVALVPEGLLSSSRQQRRPTASSPVPPLFSETTPGGGPLTVGEEAAAFDLKEQSIKSWAIFSVLVSIVLGALYVLWINPSTGFGDEYVAAVEALAPNHSSEVTIGLLLTIFGIAHSGLASLRPAMEGVVGARAWRVVFALTSLPLASSAIIYFINHRYDGAQLWDLKLVPGVHELVWVLSFVSFYFLYPSTFNLLEIAAVDRPKLHMWATGVMRITRHPQMVGQGLWCLAHTLWMGNSFVLVASAFLMAHHLFGCWNGDRRLRDKYGDEVFEAFKEQTSVLPFAAILEGRQELPADYWKEWARMPYLIIAVGTIGAYLLHPFMQAGSWVVRG